MVLEIRAKANALDDVEAAIRYYGLEEGEAANVVDSLQIIEAEVAQHQRSKLPTKK